MEETFNKQNDRVHARSSKEVSELVPRIERGYFLASVMIWWGVSYDGVTFLHFCEKGVKTAAKNYQRDILSNVVEPLIFQQDSASELVPRIERGHFPASWFGGEYTMTVSLPCIFVKKVLKQLPKTIKETF